MMDCIASYHLNPWTCGIAKFNRRLAAELHVPCVPILGLEHSRYAHPLVSVNPAEFSQYDRYVFVVPQAYDVFLHGFDPTDRFALQLAKGATRVWVGNPAIAEAVKPTRPDARVAWCPGTICVSFDTVPTIRVLTFGMAHKLDAGRYRRLRDLLEASRQTYRVDVSTALHERTPWEDALPELEAEMGTLFGSHVRLLGNLSDAAMSQALIDATALAAFFPGGVRSNNTTVWAALEHGCPVITNLDEQSPLMFAHNVTVFDVDALTEWPSRVALQQVSTNGWAMLGAYSWRALAKFLGAA